MSVRAIPLLLLAVFFYFIVVLLLGGEPVTSADGVTAVSGAEVALQKSIFSLQMLSKGLWTFTWGDLLLLLTLVLLFIELLKSTYTGVTSSIDQGLSTLVLLGSGALFLMVPSAATSVFFLIVSAILIDVIAGYTISVRVARRDLNIGGDS